MSVLLDAFALIALLADEPAADQVERLLRRGEAAITVINLAEAVDVLQRVQKIGRERLDAVLDPLLGEPLQLLGIDLLIALAAADIRARRYHRTRSPLSIADCVLLAAAAPGDSVATADEALIRAARAEGIAVTRLRR